MRVIDVETNLVAGGVDAKQFGHIITMGVGTLGDIAANVILTRFGIPQEKFFTKFVVIPGVKIIGTYVGFEVSNYFTQGMEEKA